MLLAFVGPNSVGKTLFIHNAMNKLADNTPYNLHIVQADNGRDYELDGDKWILRKNGSIWKGTKSAKIAQVEHMIRNRDEMWVVESARFFNGLNDIIVPEFDKSAGGFRWMVVTTTATILKQFLQDRNIKNNHEFNAEYWTDNKLMYECVRYDNAFGTHYRPVGIIGRSFHICYDRKEFMAVVMPAIISWVCLPVVHGWYRV